MDTQAADMPNVREHTVRVLAVHTELMDALTALEKLTTECATNPGVMDHISLAVYEAAVDAEERARNAVNEIGGL